MRYGEAARIAGAALERLSLFPQAVLMENIVAEFEWLRRNGEGPECDGALKYLVKCMEDGIPYLGFFDKIDSSEEPFALGADTGGVYQKFP